MSVIKGLDGLDLDKDTAFHKKVGFIVANVDTVLEDLDALLLDHLDLCFAQFVGKRILIDLLQEPRPQFIGHSKATTDDQPGKGILNGHDVPPYPYLPTHSKKFSTGMNADERGWKRDEN
jgi:hypothetical protein